MSLVGTRPILQDELLKYELHHRARIAIKPGITGMWQVSGRSDITDFEEVVRLDTEYIECHLRMMKSNDLCTVDVQYCIQQLRLLVCLHFYCLHCSSGLEIKIKELGGYGNSEMNRKVVVNGGKRSTSII